MRPLLLEVEGFTSFRDRARIDFSGLDLFAITGPTGAGKSSLIEAMVLALYGQVPRVGDRSRQLISHGADRLSVRLDFQVGAERYRVARTIREAGASQARLERLVNGHSTAIADRVKDIQEQVERIVGLDYDAFTRSVVLPQGQFDAFLKGRPEERRKILVSLLDLGVYEKMHAVVNREAGEARREAQFVAAQLAADFARATEPELLARRADLQRVTEELAGLERAEEALVAGLSLAQALRVERAELGRLTVELESEVLRREAAEAALARTVSRRAELEARAAELAERQAVAGYDEARLVALTGLRPVLEQQAEAIAIAGRLARELAERQSALRDRRREREAASRGLPALELRLTRALEEVEAARGRLEGLRLRHAAQAIRAQLKAGDPCPVCEQPLPGSRAGAVAGLEGAESALARAEAGCRTARQELEAGRVRLERLGGSVERIEAECGGLEARHAEAEANIERGAAALRKARFPSRGRSADLVLEDVRRELEALEQARLTRERTSRDLRDLETARTTVESEAAAARSQAESARARSEDLAQRRVDAGERVRRARERLGRMARREGWSLDDGTADGDLFAAAAPRAPRGDEQDALEARRQALHKCLTAAHARRAGLERDVSALEAALLRAEQLRERRRALDEEAALAASLAQHLQANQFLAYVQEEALRVLAEDGSRHMMTLSQRRYSLEFEGQDFCVLDHWNGDARRSVKTLSGGETFLASLSLALALAGRLAELSPERRSSQTLQSLFLDEGFGTLDAEALEVAVTALETLQGGERMVGVVTHIPELAERMPARVQVSSSGGLARLSVG
jgi:exonuclease SbcC